MDELGHSLTSKLSQEFGVIFVLGYIASYMLVTMGIFNVPLNRKGPLFHFVLCSNPRPSNFLIHVP